MSFLSNRSVEKKYRQIFEFLGIKSDKFIRMNCEGADNIQLLTKENVEVYKVNQPDSVYINIFCDGIITKESIPLIITPGDCAVIAITGVDKKDRKRFIIFLHSGLSSTVLEIYKKAIKLAHLHFDFENRNLHAFIYPYIKGNSYKKEKNNSKLAKYLRISDLKKYLIEYEGYYGIDFGSKIKHDLERLGIKNIREIGFDTYEYHKKGKLYSYVYGKENVKDKLKRFAVGVSLY